MKLVSELWKDIKGFEGSYQVSTKGNVRSLDRWVTEKTGIKKFIHGKMEVLHNQYKDGRGYYKVSLHKDGKEKKLLVHRLVAIAFIPNPNNLPEVNHIDEDKHNNDVNNLEWCTRLENIHHGTGLERCIKSRCVPIVQLDMDGNFIREWQSFKEAEECGLFAMNAFQFKTNIYHGYFWIKKNEYDNMNTEQVKEYISFKINELNKNKTINNKKTMERASKPVVQMDLDGNFIKQWKSATEAKSFGFDDGGIRACARKELKTSQGYKWMELEDYNKLQENY